MDSFYEAPRQPPTRTTINNFQKIPTVPEVSVIEFTARCPRQGQDSNVKDPPYFNPKKSVRFEGPSGNYHPLTSNIREDLNNDMSVPHNFHKKSLDLGGKTFEQIYMANVPNRHLDLSVLDTSDKISTKVPDSRSIFEPTTTCKPVFLCNNKDLSIVAKPRDNNYLRSIENVKGATCTTNEIAISTKVPDSRSIFVPTTTCKPAFLCNNKDLSIVAKPRDNNYLRSIENVKGATCTTNEIAKPSAEPTMKDLFTIIQQQNEQIMMLQQQVNCIRNSIQDKENAPQPPFLRDFNSPQAKGRSKFSIDLKATSFEVSFRPPQHGKFRRGLQSEFAEPKIQEINETGSCRSKDKPRSDDLSLRFDESLDVGTSYASEVPSIQIDMEEYKSSDGEEDVQSPEIGVTFYKDLMDQVNNVLKKMQIHSECQTNNNNKKRILRPFETPSRALNAAKQATLDHLKTMGVNLPPIQESGGQSVDQSEISFQVKQLLMKYLPDDKLAQVLNKQKRETPNVDFQKEGLKMAKGADFSVATLQYMEKYNILGPQKNGANSQKILDVTALKLQPKLL